FSHLPAAPSTYTLSLHDALPILAILKFMMTTDLYGTFGALLQPFIGAMYDLFSPWIYILVPIGVLLTYVFSKGSLQATLKSLAWGVLILATFMLMGNSTSWVVTKAANIVTEL